MKHSIDLEKNKAEKYKETILEMSSKIDAVANKNSALY